MSISCTPLCTHSLFCTLAPLLADHAPGHDEWSNHFMSILVERSRCILTSKDTWPPGFGESLRALLCLPVSSHLVHPEIPKIVFAAICDTMESTGVPQALVSVSPEWRSWTVPDAAVRCITSLVVEADTEGAYFAGFRRRQTNHGCEHTRSSKIHTCYVVCVQ